jgi:hypothetical protein
MAARGVSAEQTEPTQNRCPARRRNAPFGPENLRRGTKTKILGKLKHGAQSKIWGKTERQKRSAEAAAFVLAWYGY